MKLLAFLLYGSLQAVRYKDCGTTGMKINDIKGESSHAKQMLHPFSTNGVVSLQHYRDTNFLFSKRWLENRNFGFYSEYDFKK